MWHFQQLPLSDWDVLFRILFWGRTFGHVNWAIVFVLKTTYLLAQKNCQVGSSEYIIMVHIFSLMIRLSWTFAKQKTVFLLAWYEKSGRSIYSVAQNKFQLSYGMKKNKSHLFNAVFELRNQWTSFLLTMQEEYWQNTFMHRHQMLINYELQEQDMSEIGYSSARSNIQIIARSWLSSIRYPTDRNSSHRRRSLVVFEMTENTDWNGCNSLGLYQVI